MPARPPHEAGADSTMICDGQDSPDGGISHARHRVITPFDLGCGSARVRASEATRTRAAAKLSGSGRLTGTAAVASPCRMSIPHRGCDTLLWSRIVEHDTSLFANRRAVIIWCSTSKVVVSADDPGSSSTEQQVD